MEYPEPWNAQDDKADERIQHLPCIFKQQKRIVENPISQHATEHYNGTINQKNAPIRQ